MKCSKCNNNITSGQEVCLKCGHILRYESEEQTRKCIHCNRPIPLSYKKCPYCKKSQKSKKKKILSLIFIIVVVLINYHYINCLNETNDIIFQNKYDKYQSNISYEELVRKNVYYDESYITFTGKIISIESTSRLTNSIKIKMYLEDDKEKIVEVKYMNRTNIGFLKDDEITVFGKYKKLKGNIPEINAQKIKMN